MARGQAERLFPMLEDLLAAAASTWADLDAIACGTGPGNFTGIRLSVSSARGLSLSLGIPARGVSGLQALAHGVETPVVATVDARRAMFYAQAFGPDGDTPPALLTGAETEALIRRYKATVIGHEAEALAAATGTTARAPLLPLAEAMARIAAAHTGDEARPAPLYLRQADAAPARDAGPRILL